MIMLPLSLLVLHFVADFCLQSDWMALNKSKSNRALVAHVYVYTLVMQFGCPAITEGQQLMWLGLMFATHFLTDWVTSRLTSKLWFIDLEPLNCVNAKFMAKGREFFFLANIKSKKRHWFFVTIGADQLIHFATLAFLYRAFS